MFDDMEPTRLTKMSEQELRWFENIKKAIFDADTAYRSGKPENRCFEEICKAIDTAKTLRRSLLGLNATTHNNKQLFIEFLDFELPSPARGGMNLQLTDARSGQAVRYSFSSLIYAIRCMIHENENLNAAEQPDYHVLLDWTQSPHDRCSGILGNGTVTLNARMIWLRTREVVAKFVVGIEAMIAIQKEQSFSRNFDLGSIRPGAQCNEWVNQ